MCKGASLVSITPAPNSLAARQAQQKSLPAAASPPPAPPPQPQVQAAQPPRAPAVSGATNPVSAEAAAQQQERQRFQSLPSGEIVAIQSALKATGHYNGSVDGNLGPGTEAAVREWQRGHRLTQTGYLTDPQVATLKQQALAEASRAAEAERQKLIAAAADADRRAAEAAVRQRSAEQALAAKSLPAPPSPPPSPPPPSPPPVKAASHDPAVVSPGTTGGRRIALVVGNGAYRSIDRLPNAANDARLVARTVRDLGFTLIGGDALLDLDKAAFDKAVQSFGDQLTGSTVALFYYSGHGMQVRGTNYLVPVSANPTRETDVDFQLVDAQLVLRQMEAGDTKLNLMILDACRNNPFGGRGLRAVGGGLAQMQAPKGTLISYATQPGNVAYDGVGSNSPYTSALVDAMRGPSRGVFDVFNQVGLKVKESTGGQQQPWLSSSPIEGDFYFVPPKPVAPPPAARPRVVTTGTDAELLFWQSIVNSTDPADFQDYLTQYPDGSFTSLARRKIATLQRLAPSSP